MKRKDKPKKLGYFERNFFKNHQIFMEKFYEDVRFFEEIIEWQMKLMLTDQAIGDPFSIRSFKNHKLAHEYGVKLGEKILKNKNFAFIEWFNKFFDRYDLSKNWETPILNFIACGYYCPPKLSTLRVEKVKEGVVLYLDKKTSLNDIRSSWSVISDKLGGDNETKRRISKTFFKNIEEQMKSSKVSSKKFYNGETNEYEEKNQIHILHEIYEDDEEKLDEIERCREKILSRFRTNKHRMKNYIK